MLTTKREVRQAFWLTYYVNGKPRKYEGKTQNELPASVRQAFVAYVNYLHRVGTISNRLAASVTL